MSKDLPDHQSDGRTEADDAERDQSAVFFQERPARLPFVDQRLALFVLLQSWIKVSLFHVGSGKRKSPAGARLGVCTKKPALGGPCEFLVFVFKELQCESESNHSTNGADGSEKCPSAHLLSCFGEKASTSPKMATAAHTPANINQTAMSVLVMGLHV